MVDNKKLSRNTAKNLTANIFSKILYKLNFSNKKSNQFLLGIDLLKENVKKDLLCIVTLRLEETYTNLLTNLDSTSVNFLQKNGETLFFLFIKKTCEDFLTQQYGYKVKINAASLKKSLYTKNVLSNTEILFQVPLYAIIDPKSPIFRLIYSPIYNYASESFIEALVDNLILEVSNCIVYFNIVNFSSVYAFRQTLYKSKFLSLRNFERFKNNLSWQLRVKTYIQRPINLYNNRYEIYTLRTRGIYNRTIYANRSKEINSLKKLPLLTIVLVEVRDFLTSRLDETIYIVSKSLRFTLTSVLGQVIGLIWRGIIEGLKK